MKGRAFTNNNFPTSAQITEKNNDIQDNSESVMNNDQNKNLNVNFNQNEFSLEDIKKVT